MPISDDRHKRSLWHDYHERCIYLVAVSIKDRRPRLGTVAGDTNKAWISLSAEGKAVWREIEALPNATRRCVCSNTRLCLTMCSWCCMSPKG